MSKRLLLLLTILIFAAWLQAQDKPMGSSASTGSEQATVQGCLSNSRGHYYIATKDGANEMLYGQARQLGRLVGHEVQLTGKHTTRTYDATLQGAASSGAEVKVFNVKAVKDVAATCQ